MSGTDPLGAQLLRRGFHVVAALVAIAAVTRWLAPVNVPSANLQPFACGAPASPAAGSVAELVCRDAIGAARGWALGLAIAAIVVLAAGELARRTALGRRIAVSVALAVALPVLVLAITSLFLPVAQQGADGTRFSCGSAISPVTEPFYKSLCADLPQTRKAWALGWIAGSLALVAGSAYVSAARPRSQGEPAPEQESAGSESLEQESAENDIQGQEKAPRGPERDIVAVPDTERS